MTIAFVLDASVAIAGLSADEENGACAMLLERAVSERVAIPGLWPYEVANILMLKERRKTISPESRTLSLKSLGSLRLEMFNLIPGSTSFLDVVDVAAAHGLTIYDASYLDLAKRLKCPLATLDKKLLTAAQDCGVVVL